jgi:hypothetical protein
MIGLEGLYNINELSIMNLEINEFGVEKKSL